MSVERAEWIELKDRESREIEDDVQKVMDIMVDSRLRNAKAELAKLLSIKGGKVDARGVEVQGRLDVD